ncbi:aromatic ring-hydroxylating dioxygenase subunit alpha [Pseudoalteromonas sp. MMG022]|uniref:aromatic ring-hydroxylating oxygenase subunit alpha n=1 Tax=Pseudoalteromonas sp. MMG022 TaxID=2909978 RepID=UPI001F1EB6D8|nr:aromatic ring-hydroxylating dioxygenase subunit alpha [Pseudoalteromonas sp. MMG022]MCF6435040.1 aromatic ring-hydroxylating dioxygenase subunit alpha [Pseudoalteromonas sp. MMG022]
MRDVKSLGLNREAYFSEEWFAKEQKNVFAQNWSFVGVENDVKNNGDYICTTVGNLPLFVIRDNQGQLRAFHNICRHRGTVMLRDSGNISSAIECGYHCWRYDLTGELRSIPQQAKQFSRVDKKELSLYPAAVNVFKSMVFIHPDPDNAPDFTQWIGEFGQHFGPYDLSELEQIHSVNYDMNANWKLFIENHIESYHLWYAHKNSILGLDHKSQVNHYYNGHWSFFQSTLVEGKMAEFEKYLPSKIIAPNETWFGSGDHMIYPNLGVVTGAKFVAMLKAVPTSSTTSQVQIRVFGKFMEEGEQDQGQYYEDAGSSEEFNVNQEDIDLCERVQKGMMSDLGGIGALAEDYEQSIKHFHDKYLTEMAE